MEDKLVLRFLGLLTTSQYTLEQSHGVPPSSVALDNTTLKDEGSCGYPSVKTVRSIVQKMNWKFRAGVHEHPGVCLKRHCGYHCPGGYTREYQNTAQSCDGQSFTRQVAPGLSQR